jgi:hypothetical protein
MDNKTEVISKINNKLKNKLMNIRNNKKKWKNKIMKNIWSRRKSAFKTKKKGIMKSCCQYLESK